MIKSIAPRGGMWHLAGNLLAVASAATLILTPYLALGCVLAAATLAVNLVRHRSQGFGRCLGTRPVLVAGLLAGYAQRVPGLSPMWTVAGVVLILQVASEGILGRLVTPKVQVANLPAPRRASGQLHPVAMFATNATLIGVLIGCLATGAPPRTALLATGCCALVYLLLGLDALRIAGDPAALAWLHEELCDLRPTFLVHFSAPSDMTYQVLMWLPHLERVGLPFAVVVREPGHLAEVAAATRAPVVSAGTIRALEQAVTPGLRAVFYVNNGMKNSHVLRFTTPLHVQLLHGDSDKAASFNRVTAMFDRVYVAGQAGIDRYAANGITIAAERFRIVGRPQLATMTVGPRHAATPTVLYAPTWTGFYEDANHSSLPVAEQILTRLLDRGVTVILRAHPYTARNRAAAAQLTAAERLLARDRQRTGRQHLWGEASTRQMSLVDCANHADAMVADVSSVVTDFLYSGRPFAITDMTGAGAEFAAAFPLASIGYVIDASLADLDVALDQLLGPDPLAVARQRARTYYLGDIPAAECEQRFLDTVRADLADRSIRLPEQAVSAPHVS